jgi:hypothetical protein
MTVDFQALSPYMQNAVREHAHRTGMDGYAAAADLVLPLRKALQKAAEAIRVTAQAIWEAYTPIFRDIATYLARAVQKIQAALRPRRPVPPGPAPLPINGHAYRRRTRNRRRR